jgi:hypothetical protein
VKEIYYTYNNEAIASCVILLALQQTQTIDIARSCLILPFLLDDRTVDYLQTIKTDDLNLKNFIQAKPRLFTSFNKRYLALLPITINALMILSKGNQIYITPNISLKKNILPDNIEIGKRFNEIKEALPVFLKMIAKHETTQLYQLLNIQL